MTKDEMLILQAIQNTLEMISVSGRSNLDYLLASIKGIENLLKDEIEKLAANTTNNS